jgi:hypothetical protein
MIIDDSLLTALFWLLFVGVLLICICIIGHSVRLILARKKLDLPKIRDRTWVPNENRFLYNNENRFIHTETDTVTEKIRHLSDKYPPSFTIDERGKIQTIPSPERAEAFRNALLDQTMGWGNGNDISSLTPASAIDSCVESIESRLTQITSTECTERDVCQATNECPKTDVESRPISHTDVNTETDSSVADSDSGLLSSDPVWMESVGNMQRTEALRNVRFTEFLMTGRGDRPLPNIVQKGYIPGGQSTGPIQAEPPELHSVETDGG